VHKVKNVLNCFPKQMAPGVKSDLNDIQHAETRADAETALITFSEKYGVKYAKGVACLIKDKEEILAFFDFPADHWGHLRTSPTAATSLRLATTAIASKPDPRS